MFSQGRKRKRVLVPSNPAGPALKVLLGGPTLFDIVNCRTSFSVTTVTEDLILLRDKKEESEKSSLLLDIIEPNGLGDER